MAGEKLEWVDRAAVVEAIRRMNEEDLLFLNRLVVERLKLIGQARSTVMLARFSVGDRVSFRIASGEQKAGVIIRLNKKTASIVIDEGQQWNVHPGLLTSAAPGETEPQGQSRG